MHEFEVKVVKVNTPRMSCDLIDWLNESHRANASEDVNASAFHRMACCARRRRASH